MTRCELVDVHLALKAVQDCRAQIRDGEYQKAMVNTSIALVFLESESRKDRA